MFGLFALKRAEAAELGREIASAGRCESRSVSGGGVLLPLGDYGFSRRFGWVNDRFGVSWQLNLP